MNLEELVDELVTQRSSEALEALTSTKNDEVLEALIQAAGALLKSDTDDDADEGIMEQIRSHVVECKPIGLLGDALSSSDATTREFALSCLSEIGDHAPIPLMINLLEHRDPATREAAAEHLSLLAHYDFGKDVAKWREWHERRLKGLEEQVVEDREDVARRLRLQHRGKRGGEGEEGGRKRRGGDGDDDDDDNPRGGRDDDDDLGPGRASDDDDDF